MKRVCDAGGHSSLAKDIESLTIANEILEDKNKELVSKTDTFEQLLKDGHSSSKDALELIKQLQDGGEKEGRGCIIM